MSSHGCFSHHSCVGFDCVSDHNQYTVEMYYTAVVKIKTIIVIMFVTSLP